MTESLYSGSEGPLVSHFQQVKGGVRVRVRVRKCFHTRARS